MLESKDLELTLDFSGKIIAVKSCSICHLFSVGSLFVRYLDASSQIRFLDYLLETNNQGYAIGHEMTITTPTEMFVTSLLLLKQNNEIILFNLHESTQTLKVLEDVIRMNNELTNEIRKHYQHTHMEQDYQVYLQDITKLNSELVNFQRALTKKNKELERLNGLLETLSLMDELTKVGNRRKFFKDVRNLTFDPPCILVMIDFNDFKQVNDTKGHEQGDLVLQIFANEVKQIITPLRGELYRLGGDEFSLLVPANTKFQFSQYIDKINHKLSELHPLVSIAFAETTITKEVLKDTTFEKVMSETDEKMYQNKFKLKKQQRVKKTGL